MNMKPDVDVVIVGAGPYGLSIAAHLHHSGIPLRIFGPPMKTWSDHMPKGMLLKSDGFASSLSDPQRKFPIRDYCAAQSISYDDLKIPVELKTFVEYGRTFQQRFVPHLDTRTVTHIERQTGGFKVTLEDGQFLTSHRVIVAAGITHFPYVPEALAALPEDLVTHSLKHSNLEKFNGRKVAVVGAGASAVDLAVLLHEAGACASLIGRRHALRFLDPPSPHGRSLWQRVRNPSSGLGPGMKSRFYCDAPGIFRYLPLKTRLKLLKTSLGPAPGYPMRARLEGKVNVDLGTSKLRAEEQNGQVLLKYIAKDGTEKEKLVDHVIAATGYRVDTQRIPFLSEELRNNVKTVLGAPVLTANFEASIPGLYFVGLAAASSFGPLMRFAYGSDYAARRIGRHVPKSLGKPRVYASPIAAW